MFLRRFAVIVPRSTRFFSSKDSLDVASTIAELNKEMESVFGEPPPDGLANSGNRSCMAQDAHHNSHVILVNNSRGAEHSAGLGVLSMAVQAVVRMTGNADTAAQNFFLLDKDVQFCTPPF
ncbi:hypothetical protein V6Z11_D08G125700 [Gossypium hirsutum]